MCADKCAGLACVALTGLLRLQAAANKGEEDSDDEKPEAKGDDEEKRKKKLKAGILVAIYDQPARFSLSVFC